jgi:hypothetical protein
MQLKKYESVSCLEEDAEILSRNREWARAMRRVM